MRGTPTSSPRARMVVITGAMGVFAVLASPLACGTDPVGVDACKRIEKVRCESAPACGISLERPYHSGSSAESDVAACIRFYDEQCGHGLVVTKEPSNAQVDACVNAIITGDCTVVQTPESNAACSFLLPPAAADASADADAATTSDAATD